MDEFPRHSINWSVDEQWRWPAYKFGLKEEDLVGPLYQRFNTKALPVQSLECFHLDVRDIATAAPRGNVDALHAKLEERAAQRRNELSKCWSRMSQEMATHPECFADLDQYHAFFRFSREFSFEALVELAQDFYNRRRRRDPSPDSFDTAGNEKKKRFTVRSPSPSPILLDNGTQMPTFPSGVPSPLSVPSPPPPMVAHTQASPAASSAPAAAPPEPGASSLQAASPPSISSPRSPTSPGTRTSSAASAVSPRSSAVSATLAASPTSSTLPPTPANATLPGATQAKRERCNGGDSADGHSSATPTKRAGTGDSDGPIPGSSAAQNKRRRTCCNLQGAQGSRASHPRDSAIAASKPPPSPAHQVDGTEDGQRRRGRESEAEAAHGEEIL